MKLILHNFRVFYLIGFWGLLTGALAAGGESPRKEVGLVFEGSFSSAEMTTKLEGAKKTKLVAAYLYPLGLRTYRKSEWQEDRLTWEKFNAQSAETADQLAENLEPRYSRDSRRVIEYAVVRGGSPLFTSVVTSPKFLKKFETTIGKKLHVVIVDRHVIYVFPASGGKLGEYAPAMRRIYKQTPLPVSLEIVEVSSQGYRVIGEIEQPVKTKIGELPQAPKK